MNMSYNKLFFIFFKIGTVLLGGGYVILPFLKEEFVDKQNLITNDELLEYYALSQCTPGIIAVNVATFIGNKLKGRLGGIVAALGVIVPAFISIILVASIITKIINNNFLQYAFQGVRVAVLILILLTVKELWETGIKRKSEVTIFAFCMIGILIINLSPTFIITASAAIAIIYNFLKQKREDMKQ